MSPSGPWVIQRRMLSLAIIGAVLEIFHGGSGLRLGPASLADVVGRERETRRVGRRDVEMVVRGDLEEDAPEDAARDR